MTGVELAIRRPGEAATDPRVWPDQGPLPRVTVHVAVTSPSGPVARFDVALYRGPEFGNLLLALLPAVRGMGPLYAAAVRGLQPKARDLAAALDDLPAGSAVLTWDGVGSLAVEWHPGPCESWPGAEPSAHRLTA